MKTKSKTRQARLKLSAFLAKHGVRYVWKGTWPAIPVALPANAPALRRERVELSPKLPAQVPPGMMLFKTILPPDLPPVWVETIYENLFEKILPLKNAMTLEFYDAAIFGYAYSTFKRESAGKSAAWKRLPHRTKEEADKKDNERTAYDWLRQQYEPTLEGIRCRMDGVLADWKLPDVADYLNGFAYGIECQQREESWTPSATTETLQNYKALLIHQDEVNRLIQQHKTAREIGRFIAERAIMLDGKSSIAKCIGTNEDAWAVYLANFHKLCDRIGLPLRAPGRPAKIQTRQN